MQSETNWQRRRLWLYAADSHFPVAGQVSAGHWNQLEDMANKDGMAVIRSPPPSPQQGSCGPNPAIMIALTGTGRRPAALGH